MKKIITLVAVMLVGLTNGQECATQAEDNFGADVETSRKYISLYSSYLGQKKLSGSGKLLVASSIRRSQL
jgi:hypothetical protein